MRRATMHVRHDPGLEAAAAAAHATFGYFWRELTWERRRVVPALDLAAVKAPFADGDTVEHLWLDDVEFDGVSVAAVVASAPVTLSTVRPGDVARLEVDEVEDWLFAVDGVAYGGWTVRVVRGGMGRLRRRRHDRLWGLEFSDQVRLVVGEDEHPERLDDHPMALASAGDFAEHLRTDPAVVDEPDEQGFTMLHREAIAGNRPLVEALLEAGADRAAVSPRGMTAAEHADRLGWHHVVRTLAS